MPFRAESERDTGPEMEFHAIPGNGEEEAAAVERLLAALGDVPTGEHGSVVKLLLMEARDDEQRRRLILSLFDAEEDESKTRDKLRTILQRAAEERAALLKLIGYAVRATATPTIGVTPLSIVLSDHQSAPVGERQNREAEEVMSSIRDRLEQELGMRGYDVSVFTMPLSNNRRPDPHHAPAER